MRIQAQKGNKKIVVLLMCHPIVRNVMQVNDNCDIGVFLISIMRSMPL